MQVFLLFGTFADQFVYTHFSASYRAFREKFRFPKVLAHGPGEGLVSPSWFIDPGFGFDKKMDWQLGKKVGRMIFFSIFKWVEQDNNDEELLTDFKKLLKMEVQIEFGKNTQDSMRVWNILRHNDKNITPLVRRVAESTRKL